MELDSLVISKRRDHCENGKLLVTIILPYSKRLAMTVKNSSGQSIKQHTNNVPLSAYRSLVLPDTGH